MTHKENLSQSAALLNDTDRAVYTDVVELPYLNLARMELEEIFELNSIPVTNETSAVIVVPSGVTTVGFGIVANSPQPKLPDNLVEIRELWESNSGQNVFIPMTKLEFITGIDIDNTPVSFFRFWSWQDQEIRLPNALVPIDIKLDYIQSLFTFLYVSDLNSRNLIRNTDLFFQYRTAGLCAEFIMHDEGRAQALNGNAASSLANSLGISVKGTQSITTRRRPFRAGFKMRRVVY